jgi:hypothetical protein
MLRVDSDSWHIGKLASIDEVCTENQNTHFMFNNFPENHTVYEIMWKNMVHPDRSQMTI